MRTLSLVLITIIAWTSTGHGASRRSKQPTEDLSSVHKPPAAGSCGYVQPGVKVCSTLPDGQGAFDVFSFMPAVLYVRTEEPIVRFVPPDPRYFQSDQRENTVVIIPTKDHLPERTPAILSTRSLTITLNVRRGSPRSADTQLTILDPSRSRRGADVALAVSESEQKLGPRIIDRLRVADLASLAERGAEIRAAHGKTIARNAELIVLRARDVVRLGNRRFLLCSVQNRSAEAFSVTAIHVWQGDQALPAPWQASKTTIGTAEEVGAAIELPPTLARVAKLRVRVDEADPKRSIELPSVEIR
jgi:hypothetical protein